MNYFSSKSSILEFQLLIEDNSNSFGCKQVIKEHVKQIQQRVYLSFTSHQTEYLAAYVNEKIPNKILKNRIQQITNEAMQEVSFDILRDILHKSLPPESNQLKGYLNIEIPSNLDLLEKLQNEYFSQRYSNTVKAQNCLKKINDDFLQFKKAKQKKKQIYEAMRSLRLEKEAAQKFKLQKQKAQLAKKGFEKRIQYNENRKIERQKNQKQFQEFFKQYKNRIPTYVLMEEKFKTTILKPQKEEKQRQYHQSIKKNHQVKPTLQEINEHQRSYESRKFDRKQKTICTNKTINWSYKSQFYLNEEERLRERKEQTNQMKEYIQRIKQYDEVVRRQYKPIVSRITEQSKQDGPTKMISEMNRKQRTQVGKEYLQFMKNMKKKIKQSETKEQVFQPSTRYPNYLEDLKQKKHEKNHKISYLEQQLRNNSGSIFEKRDQVLRKTKLLEQGALRREKVLIVQQKQPQMTIEQKAQIDQTLLSAMKAKIALINNSE